MARPKSKRRIYVRLTCTHFKPQGVTKATGEVNLANDEVEALRLKYVKGLNQYESADKMGISQSTFQRILSAANVKVANALLSGQAIKLGE
ncbi:MAG TPA: DUF134 domain-containing protein [bacterium]|nr:DUF134 domain-containing protein [bacterium]